MTTPFFLDSRAVVSVSGPDAAAFLNGIVTAGVLDLAPGERRSAALLSPQGKIFADMLLERTTEGYLADCDASVAEALVRRLAMFRLRAKVEIAARPDLGVQVFAGRPDPRHEALPLRLIAERSGKPAADPSPYHLMRIAAGIPEQGADFGPDEVFPADVNFDLTGGVDFRKGCFIGQEVVSRMKRRGTARRRTLQLTLANGACPPPCPVLDASGAELGALTSCAGDIGLARIRIDRLKDIGTPLTVDGKEAFVIEPDWLAGERAAMAEAQASR